MLYDRTRLKWNGWGWRDKHYDFEGGEAAFWGFLQQELGVSSVPDTPAIELAELQLPAGRLSAEHLQELRQLLGERVVTSDFERVFHARGRSYSDLLALRQGEVGEVPDAVVYPVSAAEIEALLRFARSQRLALIPFGGGSSVVGGVNAARKADQSGILTLDLTRMNRLLRLDPVSQLASFECGVYGPQLEEALNRQGFTAGHTPQSFEFSTLGGWIAARGAGDRSNRYGKMEEILCAARVLTPEGEWCTLALPASAAGPDLNQLIAGSEGLFGVIVEATIRIHPLAPTEHHTGFLFRDFATGVEAVRALAQSPHPPAMLRLSDEAETQFMFRFRKKPDESPSKAKAYLKKLLAWQGYTATPALLLTGLEGEAGEVWSQLPQLSASCVRHGAFPLGKGAGASWSKSRYNTPYLRDALLEHGVGVETLETAISWSKLMGLYHAVKEALQQVIDQQLGDGVRGFVMTHISHCYHDGASLYFTFAFPQLPGRELEQYQLIKAAACEAIVAQGGTLSHHHGLGADHAPWIVREKGELGMGVLKAVKDRLDPEGILNPGKWL
ncbi:MAG: FAD-binding oxidoreductase [Candidatus Sericytochromatia bacterium]